MTGTIYRRDWGSTYLGMRSLEYSRTQLLHSRRRTGRPEGWRRRVCCAHLTRASFLVYHSFQMLTLLEARIYNMPQHALIFMLGKNQQVGITSHIERYHLVGITLLRGGLKGGRPELVLPPPPPPAGGCKAWGEFQGLSLSPILGHSLTQLANCAFPALSDRSVPMQRGFSVDKMMCIADIRIDVTGHIRPSDLRILSRRACILAPLLVVWYRVAANITTPPLQLCRIARPHDSLMVHNSRHQLN